VTRLVVLSDVRICQESIAATLRGRDGFCVLDPPASPVVCPDAIGTLRAEVVVVDLAMRNGCDLVRGMRERLNGIALIGFGVNESEDEVIAFAEAGLTAYVSRDGSIDHLIEVIQSAVRGELICSPRIAGALFRRIGLMATQRERTDLILTLRERDVLRLIREDLGNKQIAERLQIAEATVKNHVHSLLEKLNVKRRAQAARATIPTRVEPLERRRG
jgi:two-component system, NarL family, nitrate/nitrite response regulator NarL